MDVSPWDAWLIENKKYLNEDQQKMVIRKAMILDKADRRKSDAEL